MSNHAGASEAPTSSRLDIRRFPWTSRLAADYAFDPTRLHAFFAGDVRRPDDWRTVIARVQARQRDRASLVHLLHLQQESRGCAHLPAREAAAQLRDPRTVVVATGQQAGLFGGPLYTVLKALSALQLAESIRRDHGVPTVAVFWVDAEDHDWAEVNGCSVLDGDDVVRTVALPDAPPAGTSVAHVTLGPSIEDALTALESALPATEFTANVLATLRQAYQPGVGMADAFARWLEAMLGPRGLVVFDASDPAAKPFAAPVLAQELAQPGAAGRLATEAGQALQSLGYHAQVTPVPDAPAVFHCQPARVSLRGSNGRLTAGDDVRTTESWADHARRQPQAFSPNVLLRPVVQDSIFPTVAYVAGPSELAYFAELGAVYEAFGVPMPLVYPRASVTVVDSNAARFLARGDVALEALQPQDESVLNGLLAASMPAAVDQASAAAERAIESHMTELASVVGRVDATLEGATRSALGRMQDDLRKLQGKIVQAAKRKDDTLRRQFKHAQALAFPSGEPQERVLATVACLNRYGPGFIDRVSESISPDLGVHTLLTP